MGKMLITVEMCDGCQRFIILLTLLVYMLGNFHNRMSKELKTVWQCICLWCVYPTAGMEPAQRPPSVSAEVCVHHVHTLCKLQHT